MPPRKEVPTPPVPSPEPSEPVQAVLNQYEGARLRKVLVEKAKRKIEGLKLYEPMPLQDDFHRSTSKERIIRGSNRSGKTLTCACECARACTGQDPYGKYPKTDGIFYCVGKDGRETGQVMWRKLSRAGAFKIIRDLKTGHWRTYRPNDPDDKPRLSEAKLAPPLIPPRLIKEISWENKKESLPKIVRMFNGWELHFFSSLGKPPHGADIDGAWFDEEILDPDWYPEMAARLVDRNGQFMWSATPQAGTPLLYELHERAEEEASKGKNGIVEFVALLEDNTHMTPEQVADFEAKLPEEERLVRVGGEFALLAFKVFPEYSRAIHWVDYFDVPIHWTRYAAIDPGRQICAVLFMAIPPPALGDFAYLYDELYIPNCDAEQFGQRMAQKATGQSFEAFIIDHQEGRKVSAGEGLSIEDMYSMALKKHNVRCEATGHNFEWGAAEPVAGVEACRLWLRERGNVLPKLRVMIQKVPNFDWEMRHYRYKRISGLVTEQPESRNRVHLMGCLRYLVQSQPKWVEQKRAAVTSTAITKYLERKWQKDGAARPKVMLGPVGG